MFLERRWPGIHFKHTVKTCTAFTSQTPQTRDTWTHIEVSKTILMEPGPLRIDWPEKDKMGWASAGMGSALRGRACGTEVKSLRSHSVGFSSSFGTVSKEAAGQMPDAMPFWAGFSLQLVKGVWGPLWSTSEMGCIFS